MARNPTTMAVVAGLLRDEQGRVLLQKRPLDKHHGGLWEFPGGKVEVGETGENALIRELNEELTINSSCQDFHEVAHAVGRNAAGDGSIVITLYKVARWVGIPTPEPGAELGWFDPSRIASLPLPPLDRDLAGQLFSNAG